VLSQFHLGSSLTTSVQKRRAFWLVDSVTSRMRDRALLLHAQGIDVQFFSNSDSFLKELDSRRAGIIIVSDHDTLLATEKIFTLLMNTPEIQGAKMIYSCSSASYNLRMFAAGLGFRDIVPEDLDDRHWLHRIRFAVASKPIDFQQPAIQTSMHQISALSLPTRIIWIAKDTMRLECRARAPIGSSFVLSGALADAFGVNSVSLTVRSTTKSNLLYRFSDALICEWSVPNSAKERTTEILRNISAEDPGPRCRVFVAIQNPSLRRELLNQFDDPRFEISTALQKNSITNDPKFFSPDMVLIESTLCSFEDEQFSVMMQNLPEHTAVAIFGKLENFSSIRTKYAPRTILTMNSVPKDIRASALNRFMPIRQKIDDLALIGGSYIPSENPLSLGEISFSTRMTRIHPTAVTLGLPFPVANFALARIDCPYIRKSTGRNLIMKVTSVYRSSADQSLKHSYIAEGYLADASPEEQKLLAETIVTTQTDALKNFQPEIKQKQDISFYRIPIAVPPPPEKRAPQQATVPREDTSSNAERHAHVAAPVPVPAPLPVPIPVAAVAVTNDAVAKKIEHETSVAEPRAAELRAVSGEVFTSSRPAGQKQPFQDKDFVKMAQRFAEPAIDLEDAGRGDFRDEVGPIIEAASDIRDDFVQGLKEGVQSDIFKSIAAIFLTILGLVVGLWLIANHVAPAWERSGSQYSEGLKELAPRLRDKSKNP
jgi:hypothetical protein